MLHETGFATEIEHAELRMESGVPVSGLVIRASACRTELPMPRSMEIETPLGDGRAAVPRHARA